LNSKNLNIVALAICKNEETTLPRWIENVRKIASKVIILDTGSEDKSMAVASALGAEVFESDMPSDRFSFAEARNLALNLIPLDTDWLIFTDVDEIIADESIEHLVEEMRYVNTNPSLGRVDGLAVTIRNRNDDGSIKTVAKNVNPRIIRIEEDRKYFFTGDLHEQIWNDTLDGVIPLRVIEGDNPIYIDHYGYTKEALERTGKSKQRVTLAERAVEQHPESLRCIEQYACALALDGQLEAADKIRTDAKRILLNEIYKDKDLSVQMLRNMMVGQFTGKEDYNGFIALYVMAINLLPEYPDFDYLYGCLCDQDEMGSAAHALMVAADQKYNKLGNIIGETAYNQENAMRIIKKWSQKPVDQQQQT
jgi:glycosyltransferase involved in cell wall biosynthesis